MALVGSTPPTNTSSLSTIVEDLRDERAASVPFPPGETSFSLARTSFADDRTAAAAARGLRSASGRSSRCGCSTATSCSCSGRPPTTTSPSRTPPTSTGASRTSATSSGSWATGCSPSTATLHRRSRLIMLPAFHRERIAAWPRQSWRRPRAALDQLQSPAKPSTCTPGRAGSRCASPCARSSASTPTASRLAPIDAAGLFEQALSFYSTTTTFGCCAARVRRGPRMQRAARTLDTLIYSEISAAPRQRRARPGHPQPPARRRRTRTARAHRPCRSATR